MTAPECPRCQGPFLSTFNDGHVLCTNCGYATNAEGAVESEGSSGVPPWRKAEWFAKRPPRKDPGLAMALSVLVLALGILYAERVKEFLMFWVLGVAFAVLSFALRGMEIVGIGLLALLWIIGIAWAHSRALDFNRDSKSHGSA